MRFSLLLLGSLALAGAYPLLSAATDAAPAAAGANASAEKEEPKIDGIAIARAQGGYIGVTIEGVRMRVTFYDEKKKKVAPDVARIMARWDPPRIASGFRTCVLLPDGPHSLLSPDHFRPPYTYQVFMTLIKAEGEEQPEQIAVRLTEQATAGSAAAEPAAP